MSHGLAQWAADDGYDEEMIRFARHLHQRFGENHWSRLFEYPWCLRHGAFYTGQWVLDVGGGMHCPLAPLLAEGGAQVITLDLANGWRFRQKGALDVVGDGCALPFHDGVFDRVLSVSVLEHVANYPQMLRELWRVLRPGGRLLVSFDVAPQARFNHQLDEARTQAILQSFRLALPERPAKVMMHEFDEDPPLAPDEPNKVKVQCLCFYRDKAL